MFDTLQGSACAKWGWFEVPSVAELQAGISGPLLVGAGGNDLTKAIEVGTWAAALTPNGQVAVHYAYTPPYGIREANIDLVCPPLDIRCYPALQRPNYPPLYKVCTVALKQSFELRH